MYQMSKDERAVRDELNAAGWPSVADDVSEGVPVTTILERLRSIGADASEVAEIVAKLSA